jgi:hypothetical protein
MNKKCTFRSGMRVYDISIGSELVIIEDSHLGEKLTIAPNDFKNFLAWMTETNEAKIPQGIPSDIQDVDVWDII